MHKVFINNKIGYDSVIGSIGVIWYIVIAIILTLSVLINYFVSDKKNTNRRLNVLLSRLVFAALLGIALGLPLYIVYGPI
jgi:RsiW-degrading membrane proteinase PrsW (M82 family)